MEAISLTHEGLLKYKDYNTDIPEELTDYVNEICSIQTQSKSKKYNNWKRSNHDKTNWLVTNKLKQDDNEKLISHFRGILNKISDSNFDDMIEEMFNLDIKTGEQLNILVNLIFQKAMMEFNYSAIYGKLCTKLFPVYIMVESEKVQFRVMLINKCEIMFEECVLIKTDQDLINSSFNNKKDMLGLLSFIGELYNNDLISNSIIYRCILSLLSKSNDNDLCAIDNLCSLISTVHCKFGKVCPNDFTNIVSEIIKLKNKKGVNSKDKFTIMDVIDLIK